VLISSVFGSFESDYNVAASKGAESTPEGGGRKYRYRSRVAAKVAGRAKSPTSRQLAPCPEQN